MKENVKDILIRALKTFIQAVVAYLTTAFGSQIAGIEVFNFDTVKNLAISLIVGALAAGFSAVWNGVIQPALNKLKIKSIAVELDEINLDENESSNGGD